MSIFIGIAGGSGAGKSTLAEGLQDMYPELIEIVHFDDYQKKSDEIELLHGMKNWDHPNAIHFDQLLIDLQTLRDGNAVTIMTKNRKVNPEYEKRGRIEHTIIPKELIIVEGYMALVHESVRNYFSYSFFLSLSDEERVKRRDKVVDAEFELYRDKVLIPMHHTYVEPSKQFASQIIDVGTHSAAEVQEIVIHTLQKLSILP
jgi:uridine kinase